MAELLATCAEVWRQGLCLIVGHEIMMGWREADGKMQAIVRCPRCWAWRPHPWT